MAKKLSNISFMPAVDGISRKLALRKETCTDKVLINGGGKEVIIPGVTYMGASVRKVSINGYGPVSKNILFMRKPMAQRVADAAELERRARFTGAVRWAAAALNDLSTIEANDAKYSQARADLRKTIAGVSASGYESINGWMMAIAYAYSLQHDAFPSGTSLPAFDA